MYVDRARNPYHGMIMSHMLADTIPELHAMADRLGLHRRWFQNEKTPHYDVCQETRERALALGAIEIDRREAALMVRLWRSRRQKPGKIG